jgi:hypothetical protein
MASDTAARVLELERRIGDLEALAQADPELADCYELMLDERRAALARLLRAAAEERGDD